MGKGPLELEGCPCIFAQGPPSSKLCHCLLLCYNSPSASDVSGRTYADRMIITIISFGVF